MTTETAHIEGLLRQAFAPIEPPAELADRVEQRLVDITHFAAGELAAWELAAMRDPRNWVRPAVAVTVGGGAAVALAVIRLRRRQHK
jgi:hypothetical protein